MFQSTCCACDILDQFPKPDVLLVVSVHKSGKSSELCNLHLDILIPGDLLPSEQFVCSWPGDITPYAINIWRSRSPNIVTVTALSAFNEMLVFTRQQCSFQINKVKMFQKKNVNLPQNSLPFKLCIRVAFRLFLLKTCQAQLLQICLRNRTCCIYGSW